MSTTNDALLREAFEAAGKGDASKLVNLYSDDTTLDTTIVMVHRFTDGKVTGGADVCPAAFENFWTTVGITG